MRQIPGIADVSTDREQGGLQANITIDRHAAARLGVRVQDINNALNNAFAQRQVSVIYTQRNQYRVILEVDPRFQRDPADLSRIFVPGRDGVQVPLTSVISIDKTLAPLVVNHQGPFPAVTISYGLNADMTLDEAQTAIRAGDRRAQDARTRSAPRRPATPRPSPSRPTCRCCSSSPRCSRSISCSACSTRAWRTPSRSSRRCPRRASGRCSLLQALPAWSFR